MHIEHAIEVLWPTALQTELQPEVIGLPALSELAVSGLPQEKRASLAHDCVIEALMSRYNEASGRPVKEHLVSVRTNSYPDITFQSEDGKLRFNGLLKLLEFAAEEVRNWALERIRPFESSRRVAPDLLVTPAQMLERAAYIECRTRGLIYDLKEKSPTRAGYHLNALALFNPEAPPVERLRDLQDVFAEIIRHQFGGEIQPLDLESGDNINGARYAFDNQSPVYSGYDLMGLYARTLAEVYPAKYRFTEECGLAEARQFGRVIRHVRDHALGRQLTRAQELSLFAAFNYSPTRIFEAWSLIHGTSLSRNAREAFTREYPGLFVEKPEDYFSDIYPGRKRPQSPRKFLINLVMKAGTCSDEEEHHPNLSPARRHLLSRLLLSLSRKEIELKGREYTAGVLERSARWFERLGGTGLDPRRVQFAADAHREAILSINAPLKFNDPGLNVTLQQYQKEGAFFLLERKRAILGDAPSLGKTVQAIAAAEASGADKIIWVTDASNRLNIKREIQAATGFRGNVIFIIDPPSEWGEKEIELPGDAKYLVVSYDTLREIEKRARRDPEWKAFQDVIRGEVSSGLKRALVVDESQYIDNPDSLRSRAVTAIQSDYTWLLSATPFQSRITSLFHVLHFIDPESFSSMSDFRQEFFKDKAGFERFMEVFENYFLGREQTEAGIPFEPFDKVPLEEQLARGLPRFAVPVRHDRAKLDKILIPDEVAELYRWIQSDFLGWADYHNRIVVPRDPENISPVVLGSRLHLQKFQHLMGVLYEPHKYGLAQADYLFKGIAAIAREYLNQPQKKVIIFARNLSVVRGIKAALGEEAQVFWGETKPAGRESLRYSFEYEDSPRVMVVQIQTGGVGLSFRRADAVIHAQPAQSISQHAQAEGRVPRNVYPGEAHLEGAAKMTVPYHHPVLVFSSKFLESTAGSEMEKIFSQGTLSQIAVERLLASNRIYEFLRAGAAQGNAFALFVQKGILRQAGILPHSAPLNIEASRALTGSA